MRNVLGLIVLGFGVAAGGAGGYWYARPPSAVPAPTIAPPGTASADDRKILYYRDPTGAPYWSAGPKRDAGGRDYVPVYDDEEISFDPERKKPVASAAGSRKI